MSPAHRADLHGLLADAVAAVYGSVPQHAEELARHRFHAARGGPPEAAYPACTAAYGRRREADLAALADELTEAAAHPEDAVLRPTAVRLLADLGEHTHARTLVRRWGLDLLPDACDWHSDFQLAELGAAAVLGTPDPAAAYRILLPFQDRLVVAGSAPACRGTYHQILADLAERLDDPEAAARHRQAPPPPFPAFAP